MECLTINIKSQGLVSTRTDTYRTRMTLRRIYSSVVSVSLCVCVCVCVCVQFSSRTLSYQGCKFVVDKVLLGWMDGRMSG